MNDTNPNQPNTIIHRLRTLFDSIRNRAYTLVSTVVERMDKKDREEKPRNANDLGIEELPKGERFNFKFDLEYCHDYASKNMIWGVLSALCIVCWPWRLFTLLVDVSLVSLETNTYIKAFMWPSIGVDIILFAILIASTHLVLSYRPSKRNTAIVYFIALCLFQLYIVTDRIVNGISDHHNIARLIELNQENSQ